MEKLARYGDSNYCDMPIPMKDDNIPNLSLTGLLTSVRNKFVGSIRGLSTKSEEG